MGAGNLALRRSGEWQKPRTRNGRFATLYSPWLTESERDVVVRDALIEVVGGRR